MKWFLLSVLGLALTAGALHATAEARTRRAWNYNSQTSVTRSSDDHQPRSRAGGYAKPSFLQGSHKALGKY